MSTSSSRRNFLTAGLALPAAGLGAVTRPEMAAQASKLAGSPELRYKTLGKTGLKVTTVAFGAMITSDQSVVEKAADLGINYFDTARGYQNGNCERMVGAALKGKRKSVIISTKSGARDKAGLQADLDASLQALQTDYVDIWYLHGRSRAEQLGDDLIEVQQNAKKQGKVRFTGVSTHGGQGEVVRGMIQKGAFDVVLAAYNFSTDDAVGQAVEQARKAGLGVVAMKVMAGGFRRVKPGDKLHAIFKRDGAMVAALKWVLKNPNIDTTIPSITDMDQLDENLKAMTAKFTPEDEKLLAAQLKYIRPLYCHMCGACEGSCAQGLPVADIIRYVSYADGYGEFGLGREHFLTLPTELTAVRCGQCPECTVQCPNGVRVAERVGRAQELFA